MTRASFIRSFLLRGTAVLITTLSLLIVMGWRGGESTGSEALQPPTETTVWITITETSLKTTCTSSVSTSGSITTSTGSLITTTLTPTVSEVCSQTQDICSEEEAITEPCTTTSLDSDSSPTFPTEAIPEEQAAEEERTETECLPITNYEYQLLCKIVCSEYGGMPDVEERAKIVASVMNQSARLNKSIEQCLYQTCVPWGFNINGERFCGRYYTDMADAVDYYFANRDTVFAGWDADSWYGSGYGTNIFHRQLY